MFKIIDRYILKELIDPFLFGLGAFTAIMSSSMVLFELVRAVIIRGMPVHVAIQLFIFRLPGIAVYIFPMAMLLAALLAFARLSSDSEITAFRSGGISLYRLIVPVLIMGFIVSLITLLFYEVVVPESSIAAKNLLVESRAKHSPKIEKNMFVPEFERNELKRIFYAKTLEGDIMKGVVVGEFEDGRLSQLINAKEAKWLKEKDQWMFRNGVIYLLSDEGEYKHLIKFSEQHIAIKYTPADFRTGDKKPEEMNIAELKEYIDLKRKMGSNVTDYAIQMNMKIAIPFACLVFALLGAPLGLSKRRASSSIGLGLSIIVIFLYYILMSISVAVGELGWLSPPVAAWLPNIITGGIGIYILRLSALG